MWFASKSWSTRLFDFDLFSRRKDSCSRPEKNASHQLINDMWTSSLADVTGQRAKWPLANRICDATSRQRLDRTGVLIEYLWLWTGIIEWLLPRKSRQESNTNQLMVHSISCRYKISEICLFSVCVQYTLWVPVAVGWIEKQRRQCNISSIILERSFESEDFQVESCHLFFFSSFLSLLAFEKGIALENRSTVFAVKSR